MAQHVSSHIEKDKIIGIYEVNDVEQKVVLTREELVEVLKHIHLILSVIKGARSIFYLDNITEIEPYLPSTNQASRSDVKIFQLASSLATQGFDLQDISIDEKSVNAILQDVTGIPENEPARDYVRKRMIHSSQFVYVIWEYFPAEEITIKHFNKEGLLRCTITGNGRDCESVSKGEVPFEELASRVVFKF